MPKTFANLRNSLSSAIGIDEYENLTTQDQANVDTIINAAYAECFSPKDGRRAPWAVKYWSEVTAAPQTVSLGLTNGSNAVTGHTFTAKYAGSFVQIGGAYYRAGSTTTLVQPWGGTTGTYSATVYSNAIAIPGVAVKLREMPNLIGIGPLAPMPFPESEIELRSTPSFDFQAKNGRVPFAFTRPRFDPSLITDVGDPRFYHIDSAATGSTFTTGSRMHLYPLPGQVFTIEARFNILPTPLSAAGDIPELPNDEVDIAGLILEPLMFERFLKHPMGRRYSGTNGAAILQAGAEAREHLNTFRSVQLSGPKQFNVSPDW